MYVNRYKKANAATANPGELVVMLYDGIIRFAGGALDGIGAGDRAQVAKCTSRAIAIVDYLQVILDSSKAPELVAALDRTYTHWIRSLARANTEQSGAPIQAILGDVAGLRDAWRDATISVSRDELLSRSTP